MHDEIVRPATAADLPALYDIWYASEVGDDPHPPPRGPWPWLTHELATGELLLAERDGVPIGFAATIARDDIVFLSDCFVRAAAQSAGIGRRLLQRLFAHEARTYCTVSSSDPRAQALYIRAGMRPRWPNFILHAETDRVGAIPTENVGVVEAHAGDPQLVAWDAAIGGRRRPEEHAYLVAQHQAIPLWFGRDGETIGYGYAQRFSPELLWRPDTMRLGPIGARNEQDALACVGAALGWARSRAPAIQISVPGPHAALAALLEARLLIDDVETFLSSSDRPFFDAGCYIPSGGTFF
ncbi:MAG TPA: GNAT family N-acetyltransferase [Roseiflexaceae bacterium]|nr:GNAT family N-acetyltransferase [Roseiflexaceae bacterium]